MKKTIIIVAVLGIAIAGAVAFYMSQKGHEETADIKAAFTITTTAVIEEFVADEAAATAKFQDQIIEVSGPLMELQKESGKVVGIKIGDDDLSVVSCTLQEPMDASALTMAEGATVTVKGVCSGFNSSDMLPGGDVELKRGSIIQ